MKNKNKMKEKKFLVMVQILNRIKNKIHLSYSYSFSFPLILSNLDIIVTDSDSFITQIFYGVFLLSIIALICFINIIGYLVVYIIIERGNYENKYPRLSKIINYYKKISLIYLSIEVLLCLICLFLLVFFSFLYIYSGINKT
jgi:hypothetical protein